MKVAIINYGAGNVRSVELALQRLGVDVELTSDQSVIRDADRVIFPGVGEASSAMKRLRESKLDTLIPDLKQPVLGICLGMQLLCQSSEEGDTSGLGIFETTVNRFPKMMDEGAQLKVPHVGWNSLGSLKGDLFKGIPQNAFVYFVHGYYVGLTKQCAAECKYGLTFSAALQQENFYATQFHPEKSGAVGEQILKNFLSLKTESTQ